MKRIFNIFIEQIKVYLNIFFEYFFTQRSIEKPILYLAFTGLSGSVKYIPDETDIVSLSGGNLISDEEQSKIEVKNVIKNTDEKFIKNLIHNPIRRSLVIWIISTATILFFASSLIYFHVNNSFTENLFRKYYRVPQLSSTIFSNPDFIKSESWMSALHFYNEHNYNVAANHFKNIDIENSRYDIAQFLLAICYIQENRVSDAQIILKQLEKNELLTENIDWYRAMCYLKQGNLEPAQVILEYLKGKNSIFSKKSGEVLQKIEAVH